MAKVAIIGAGGYVFPLRLIGDILSHPELQDCTLSLMDVDPGRLGRTADAARTLVASHKLPTCVEATTEQRRALDGADYVIVTFQIGGLEAYRLDVEIPRRYGVDQTVGDTLGPGGVFRFLRSAPVFRDIAADLRELSPQALLLNYVNPMSMICWYLDRLGCNAVGLCHSIQETSRLMARQIGVPYDEVQFLAAGINHNAWFLRFQRDQQDLYPELRRVMRQRHIPQSDGKLSEIGPDPRRKPVRRAHGTGADRNDGGLRVLPHGVQPPFIGICSLFPQERGAHRGISPRALGLLQHLLFSRRCGMDGSSPD